MMHISNHNEQSPRSPFHNELFIPHDNGADDSTSEGPGDFDPGNFNEPLKLRFFPSPHHRVPIHGGLLFYSIPSLAHLLPSFFSLRSSFMCESLLCRKSPRFLPDSLIPLTILFCVSY